MAAILIVIALYHTAALTLPVFARTAYPATYPALRHIIFILTNIFAAWLFLFRPRWMLWPVLIIAGQAFCSHGIHASQNWQQNHQINWVDPAVIAVAIYGIVILYLNRRPFHPNPRIAPPPA